MTRLAAGLLLGLSLTPIAWAIGLASAQPERTRQQAAHDSLDAVLRTTYAEMGVTCQRGLENAAIHLWAHRGPTGGTYTVAGSR